METLISAAQWQRRKETLHSAQWPVTIRVSFGTAKVQGRDGTETKITRPSAELLNSPQNFFGTVTETSPNYRIEMRKKVNTQIIERGSPPETNNLDDVSVL